jgi:serine/threonine protein kinase
MRSAFRYNMYGRSVPEEEADGQTMRGVVGGTQLFKRFTLQKVLGRGGMGIVWLARDDRLERLVALKLVPDAVCFDASAQEELKRETRKSLMLTHPNIVRIFDFIEDERTAAISMEYVDGATLSYLRVQKPSKCFDVRELAPWVTSLCDALAYAHDSARLVHRDLKPANLMVNSRSELKITDFGISCTLRDSMRCVSIHSSSGGTLNYMSPQQMLGEDPSPSDDVYALGATLYEMLSSKPPFYGGDVASQVREVIAPTMTQRRTKFEISGEPIPKQWEETIASCLAKNPERRPQTPADVARRLRLGGTIRLSDVKEPAKPLLQQTRVRVAALAGGTVALIAAISLLYHTRSTPTATKTTPKAAQAAGYAMEVPAPTAAPTKVSLEVPAKLSVATETTPVSPPSRKPEKNATLQLTTIPAGASFAVYPGVIAGKTAPITAPLHSGIAPESIGDIPPGRYTFFFHNEGWPDERAEISVHAGETLPVDYTFPHGTATITSNPDNVEIFMGERSLGRTPLTVDLPLGKQQLIARHPDLPKRTKTVMIESGTPVNVAFQLRASGRSRPTPTPPPSALGKLGNSLKKVFSHPSPSPSRSASRKKS